MNYFNKENVQNLLFSFILIVIVIIFFKTIYYIIKYESFDETKITTGIHAENRMKEYNYDVYKPYLEKYFKPIENRIDLRTIPLKNDNKIFCSVASYRDKQCPLTVMDMVKKAKNPQNLVICINQQNASEDQDCFNGLDYSPATIKILKFTDREARGPCWARYIVQQEWRGEEYFLQVDSHMRFVDEWDQKCIDQLAMLPDKSCLTNYVAIFNLEKGEPDGEQLRGPLYIVNKETHEHDGFFRVNSEFIKTAEKPMLSRGWSACYSFSKGDLLHDAPYDPYTPFLFFGEEMDILARMWSRGWNVYAPSVPICFTNFDRSYRPTFWENPDQGYGDFLSRIRLYYRFGYIDNIQHELKISLDEYDLKLINGDRKLTWKKFLEYTLDEDNTPPPK